MLLYDLLLKPAGSRPAGGKSQRHSRDSSSENIGWRAAVLAGTVAVYVGIRRAVTAGSHLVQIFRKVVLGVWQNCWD